MKLIIFREEDRLIIASLLVKNGYTVRQGMQKKSNSSKAYEYYVEIVESPGKEENK